MSFNYCPNCASRSVRYDGMKKYSCPDCGFEFYNNTASAVAGILLYNDTILFTVRNQEPQKGKLDLPGGFTDPGESAEEALIREVHEELGIKINALKYVGTFPNTYPYKGFKYTTCDVVYAAEINELPQVIEEDEISEIKLIHPDDINLDAIPFSSIRNAIAFFIHNR